ncbi:ABC transporter ATP-binding protein [Leucobacter weissii]|uniref:ABC transporter ATP-binding protein n=1 Tax=Leucobacter weissii TaxID=1983706 RepID=A0A939MMV9_9MICO|nr:ABC transporter ATP-binding protein [Leucobacter weissii]MBO1901712.1 ABC transporter ATP-binding protein [Leucobacter weissii]
MAARPRIRFRAVDKRFGTESILERLDLTVRSGEFLSIVGRSGTGKSTMLRIVAGLEQPDGGEVRIDGELAVAFQEPRLIPWLSVGRNLTLGLTGRDRAVVAERALAEVGLEDKQRAWPLTLSGGQAQRASLARALARKPDILLLDEPLGAVDALTRLGLQELIGRLRNDHDLTVVMVTHDVDEAVRLSDRVIVLGEGRIQAEVPVPGRGPRHPDDPELAALGGRLLRALGVDGAA